MTRKEHKEIRVGLTGNPNSGKTTIFNNLTGAHQHVANYPGVTVEKKEGERTYRGTRIRFYDLPGTYSLTAYSIEELIARNFIIGEKPDVIVDIVDCSNLERNLYLGLQLVELRVPLLFAFNMSDEAKRQGIVIDHERLSSLLGVPIVLTVGNKSVGMDELLERIVEVAESKEQEHAHNLTRMPPDLEEERQAITALVAGEPELAKYRHPEWIARKLLENDKAMRQKVRSLAHNPEAILTAASEAVARLTDKLGDEPEILLADHRYGLISGACQEAVKNTMEARHSLSDQIDLVLTNRALGIPIFILMMWLVFQFTFKIGQYPSEWLDMGFRWLSTQLANAIANEWWRSLVVDGIIGGVGGVIVFLPNILCLFFAIALLEGTGYMARAAFIMDRLMHFLGLHGKSFIPMLIGFGCSVPAIMATRTLESRRDRMTTIMIVPFMSCAARLPVYMLLAGAFFRPDAAGNVIFAIYLLGIVVAVVMAKLLRKTIFRGKTSPFIMELPPYRIPTLKSVLIHMWSRAWMFIRKAGTVILAFSLIIWALSRFPAGNVGASRPGPNAAGMQGTTVRPRVEHSYAARIGHVVASVLEPVGLGDWKVGTALVAGVGAKEVIVATLGTLYSREETESLRAAIRQDSFFNPLRAFVLMVFILLYVPCAPTLAIVRHETHQWRWVLFMGLYTAAIAWIVSFAVYRAGLALHIGV